MFLTNILIRLGTYNLASINKEQEFQNMLKQLLYFNFFDFRLSR
jgi:hypothetical protein